MEKGELENFILKTCKISMIKKKKIIKRFAVLTLHVLLYNYNAGQIWSPSQTLTPVSTASHWADLVAQAELVVMQNNRDYSFSSFIE